MTFVTFVLMGVSLGVLFVAALLAVFLLNRQDMRDSQHADDTGISQQYGQPQQQYGQPPRTGVEGG